jgi:hypothetical protein
MIGGGEADPKLQDEYTGKKTRCLSRRAIFAGAHTQLEWWLDQLNQKSWPTRQPGVH